MKKVINEVIPQIYCFSTPGISYHDGWVKIGYTEQGADKRVDQMGKELGVIKNIEWVDNAIYANGRGLVFTDDDFRHYLQSKGVVCDNSWGQGDEWYQITPEKAHEYFNEFRMKPDILKALKTYSLRKEQKDALSQIKEIHAQKENGEVLLNAKPRFGKSLTVLQFCKDIESENVLILTNRPAVGTSWFDDYCKFFGRESGYFFVSSVEDLKNKNGVLSYKTYKQDKESRKNSATDVRQMKMIDFVSLQDLKGSIYFGGIHNKLEEIKSTYWDVIVIDESHEGVETYRTDVALDKIKRKFTLYLSGTPFKAIKDGKFDTEDIYNWTYVDEAIAKEAWNGLGDNPYLILPQLNMYTYRLSNIVDDLSPDFSEEDKFEYLYRLNDFFRTVNKKFVHEEDVDKFLDALVSNDKFPLSSPKKRNELKHMFWLLFRVDDAKAMAEKLKKHPVFSEYEIVLAAGDGKLNEDEPNIKSFQKVRDAISTHEKTITLSVQQLTTGVTIPEWTAVFILSERNSPAQYMQAAFRAQNPCLFYENGKYFRKENAYVFDFNPEHTLSIVEQFANDLCSETANGHGNISTREENIEKLLKYLPVVGEDEFGEMIPFTAQQVLSIPRRIRCQEVVRRGFMSNMLFQNIHHVFSAPSEIVEIIKQLPVAITPDMGVNVNENTAEELYINETGEINIPEEIIENITNEIIKPQTREEIKTNITNTINTISPTPKKYLNERDLITKTFSSVVQDCMIEKIKQSQEISQSTEREIKRQINQTAKDVINKMHSDYLIDLNVAKQEIVEKYESEPNKNEMELEIEKVQQEKEELFKHNLQEEIDNLIETCSTQSIEIVETAKSEDKRSELEEEIKNHLRGFSKTIPSFLMAYGTENTTLSNFDTIIPDEVFQEVTGISIEKFRFLRDGGDYIEELTGLKKHFNGNLFDATVFNDAVKEFLKKKKELSNYFEEKNKIDIFDYIPPQQTNQIFTPKKVVKEMVDLLEQENPGCFDNPNYTFADLYMKSGLYITELVKRLYQSEKLKELFPNKEDRLNHIFKDQVYGLAPTEIIYKIATNFILGFSDEIKIEKHNFKKLDLLEYSKTHEVILEEIFS